MQDATVDLTTQPTTYSYENLLAETIPNKRDRPIMSLNAESSRIPDRVARSLTIGMPVYNGAATIRAAVNSLLAQTRRDFLLYISDNSSTDDTEALCRALCTDDERIRYVRHPVNLGAAGNFRHCLWEAQTPFFMWAAADDLWAPTFLERCLAFLDNNEDYVACQSRVMFLKKGRPSHLASGTFVIDGDDPSRNIDAFLDNPSDNSRYYAIFRTDELKASFPERDFYALDWAVSAATLLHGKHAELAEVLMMRDSSDIRSYRKAVLGDCASPLSRLLPVLYMSWYLVSRRIAAWKPGTLCRLWRLNLYIHFALSPYRNRRLANAFMQTGSLRLALRSVLKQRPSRATQQSMKGIEVATRPNRAVAVSGTHGIESFGSEALTWTNGNASFTMELHRLPGVTDVVVELWGIAPEGGIPFSIYIQGSKSHEGNVTNSDQCIRLPLCKGGREKAMTIEIVSSTFQPAGDKRLLGVPVRSLRLCAAPVDSAVGRHASSNPEEQLPLYQHTPTGTPHDLQQVVPGGKESHEPTHVLYPQRAPQDRYDATAGISHEQSHATGPDWPELSDSPSRGNCPSLGCAIPDGPGDGRPAC